MSNSVAVGASTDTGPTFVVTITRDPADSTTDWTTASGVVLVLPDGSTQTVTKTSATASTWTGTAKYNAWFSTAEPFDTRARATFTGGTTFTIPDVLTFDVQS